MVTCIGRRDGITIPWDSKHAVATGLDDKLMLSSLTSFMGDNVLYTTVATPTPSDTLERGTIRSENHGLAARVKFKLYAFILLPIRRYVELDLEPVIRPRRTKPEALLRRLELLLHSFFE